MAETLIDKIRRKLRYAEEAGEDVGAALELDAVEMAQALIAVDDVLKNYSYSCQEDYRYKSELAFKIRKAIESKGE